MRRIWDRLPGPTAAKIIEAVVLVAMAMVILFYLFEWAGGLLDSGGAIG